jgi:type IV secretion system protein VirB10
MPSERDYRSLELEQGAASSVSNQGGESHGAIKYVLPVAALGFAGWVLYSGLNPPKPTNRDNNEEFRTTQFPAPGLDTPRPQLDQGLFRVPEEPPAPEPPAPVPPPTTLAAPPAPLSPPAPAIGNDDAEARRLAELERKRLEEEERQRWARLRAGSLVADHGGTGGTLDGKSDGGPAAAPTPEDDPNRKFMARAGSASVEMSAATKNPRIDALIPQGTLIRAVLETAVQSDLAGMVRAVTTEDVWSFDGRRVLIPSGTRLIGEYKSGLSTGQTRLFIVWTRVLRSDGVSVMLGSPGTDDLGRAGMGGVVDNHYFERFGSAVMLSIVGGATQLLANWGQSSNSGQTTTITDPVTGQVTTIQPNQFGQNAKQVAAQQISQSLTNIAQEALKSSINIPPTIHIDQGSRIVVFVRRDLDFSQFYPDPVKEALREIKRERGLSVPAQRISK